LDRRLDVVSRRLKTKRYESEKPEVRFGFRPMKRKSRGAPGRGSIRRAWSRAGVVRDSAVSRQ
jgi:hypothetical protein